VLKQLFIWSFDEGVESLAVKTMRFVKDERTNTKDI